MNSFLSSRTSISNLLYDFENVFPKDLPPLRGIEHQIDFVTASQIPNRPLHVGAILKKQRICKDNLGSFLKKVWKKKEHEYILHTMH